MSSRQSVIAKDIANSMIAKSNLKIVCESHKTLNKYYLQKENKFVCEYDGYEMSGPDSLVHLPQILEKHREQILTLQKNQLLETSSKGTEVVDHFLTKLAKLNGQSSKFSYDLETFRNTVCQRMLFQLTNSNSLSEIRDLINEVKFGADNKPDLKKIGMDEQKEKNLVFLAQYLVLKGGNSQVDFSNGDLTE